MPQQPNHDLARIVDTYADTILRVSYTYLHSTTDAEDIAQEVFLKLIERRPDFRSPEHERAWVVRVAINACKDRLRSRKAHPQVPLESIAEPTGGPPDEDATPADMPVSDALAKLPEAMREAIYLHYYESYSIGEIARLTGRSAPAVAQSLSRGRRQLRQLLEHEGGESWTQQGTATRQSSTS